MWYAACFWGSNHSFERLHLFSYKVEKYENVGAVHEVYSSVMSMLWSNNW